MTRPTIPTARPKTPCSRWTLRRRRYLQHGRGHRPHRGRPRRIGNDSDPDGNQLSAVLGSGPSYGTIDLNANGSFTYTPAHNFTGTDSFTYRASDGTLTSSLTTVTITVDAVNDTPPRPTMPTARPRTPPSR